LDVIVDNEEENQVAECHNCSEYGVRNVCNQLDNVRLEGYDGNHEKYGEYLHERRWMGAAIDWFIFFADLTLR